MAMEIAGQFLVTLLSLTVRETVAESLARRTSLNLQQIEKQDTRRITNLLNDMVSGPMKGRTITIVLEDNVPTDHSGPNIMLQGINFSFLLLQLPQEAPKAVLDSYNATEDRLRYSNSSGQKDSFPLTPSVVVIIVTSDDPFWWPLWTAPEEWYTKTIVLIVYSQSCSKESYLSTLLLRLPSSLAVLCLKKIRGGLEDKSFGVWTSKPLTKDKDVLINLGTWNADSFPVWESLFIDRFQDMSKKNMTVISYPYERPLFYLLDGNLRGVNYYILTALSDWLHYKLNFIIDGLFDFSEIAEEVKKGNSDVSINPAIITSERNEEFDLTVPYLREGYGIFLEVPPPLPRWQSILFPFTWIVWGMIVFTVICTAVTYHIMNYENENSFLTNIIIVMQSLLSEPVQRVPNSWILRQFLLLWWIVSWFLNMSYMSNLIAVLTAPVFPKRLQTAEDLLKSDYRLCMLDFGGIVDESLAESTNPVLSALYDILDMMPFQPTWEHVGEEQCIEKVLAGTHAHTDTFSFVDTIYNLLGHGQKIYSFNEQLYPGYLVLLLKKNTPWKYKFDQGMRRLIEAGLVKKWHKDSLDDFKEYYQEERIPELQPLSLSHLQGSFMICLLGHFFGTLLVIWEILFPPSRNST